LTPRLYRHGWLAGALAAGLALLWRTQPSLVAPPDACPGLLHLASAALLRARPGLTIGQLATWLDTGASVALAVSAVAACTALGVSLLPAVAVAGALTTTVIFAPVLNVPAASFAAACTALGLASYVQCRGDSLAAPARLLVLSCVAIALAAMTAPPLAPALAVLAAALVSMDGRMPRVRRTLVACVAAAAILLGAWIVSFAVPPSDGARDWWQAARCSLPGSRATAVGWLLPSHALSAASPLAVALALLALLSRTGAYWRASIPWAIATVALLALARASADLAAAPLVLVGWLLAARGLEAMLARVTGWKRWAVGMCLIVALPWLQASRAWVSSVITPGTPSAGHERWSLDDLQHLTALLPPDAAIVREDAGFDLLRRAQGPAARRVKPVPLVPRQPEEVARASAVRHVFLLPIAQADLDLRGVAWKPASLWMPGGGASHSLLGSVAQVESVHACHVLGPTWIDVTAAAAHALVTLVATRDDARSRVLLVAGGTALDPGPVGWPAFATDAFSLHTLVHPVRGGTDTVVAKLRADGAPGAAFVGTPYVVRLELWRPGPAPLALRVRLGGSVSIAWARLEEPVPEGSSLMLCPATGEPPLSAR
jgi:hypothetical protein